ncbi:MAG: response regulator [Deltaproteobacteria bacterium]|nr:response regulator [Deltaproteobacteria bacterium]
MEGKTILIAEDNEDTREILLYRLKTMGNFQILLASNGKEALEIATQSKPDLIIMDLKMPVMDGWEATMALRQTAWGKDLPVIALTAQAMEKDEEKALAAGCTDYIPKPIMDYGILKQKIERHLKQSPVG